jgi:hypothetical protein
MLIIEQQSINHRCHQLEMMTPSFNSFTVLSTDDSEATEIRETEEMGDDDVDEMLISSHQHIITLLSPLVLSTFPSSSQCLPRLSDHHLDITLEYVCLDEFRYRTEVYVDICVSLMKLEVVAGRLGVKADKDISSLVSSSYCPYNKHILHPLV